MRIVNARVMPMEGDELECGYVECNGAKITSLGPMDGISPRADDIDARGGWLLPGIIEAQCQMGLRPEGEEASFSGADEATDAIAPQLDPRDGIYPLDPSFRKALSAGVTTAVIAPGDKGLVGGRLIAVKTRGVCADEMVFDGFLGVKMALGEATIAPREKKRTPPVSRMGAAALLRETLRNAFDYAHKKDAGEDVYDPKFEALLPVLRGEKPVFIHALRADDISSAIGILRAYGLRFILVSAFECQRALPRIRACGAPVLAGPLMTFNNRRERNGASPGIPKLLSDAGIPFAIACHTASTTMRSPVPAWFFAPHAAAAVKCGLDAREALRAITLYAARICGIDARVGSIRPGKDADLVLFTGHPLDYRARAEMVFVEGERFR